MKSKTKDSIILKRLGLTIITIIFFGFINMSLDKDWQYFGFSFLTAIVFIFNFHKLMNLKNLYVYKNHFEINYLFRFSTKAYHFNEILEVNQNITKDENMDTSYIDFPYKLLQVKTKNNKTYRFKSKENTDLDKIYNLLIKIKPSN